MEFILASWLCSLSNPLFQPRSCSGSVVPVPPRKDAGARGTGAEIRMMRTITASSLVQTGLEHILVPDTPFRGVSSHVLIIKLTAMLRSGRTEEWPMLLRVEPATAVSGKRGLMNGGGHTVIHARAAVTFLVVSIRRRPVDWPSTQPPACERRDSTNATEPFEQIKERSRSTPSPTAASFKRV